MINTNIDVQDIDLDDEVDVSGEDMFEHFALTVDKGQSLVRIDKFLANRLEHTSRNRIQVAADSGNILVGGRAVKSNYKIKPLDEISIVMPYPIRDHVIVGEDIPLDIVYEDDDVLVVNKKAGMVVHPGHGNYEGTLVNALTFRMQDLPLFQSGDLRAGLVHRIDKNTSGLLVIAKTEIAHQKLAKQFYDHTIERTYHALVWGNPKEDQGTIEGNIGRHVRDRLKMHVFADGSDGKSAVTHYRVLKRYSYVSLIECKLETGRTHQIRVHMSYIGHTIFNDDRYGGNAILKGTTFTRYNQFVNNCFAIMPRQGLHALSLGFVHPRTGEFMSFTSEYPADFAACLAKWEGYTTTNSTSLANDE